MFSATFAISALPLQEFDVEILDIAVNEIPHDRVLIDESTEDNQTTRHPSPCVAGQPGAAFLEIDGKVSDTQTPSATSSSAAFIDDIDRQTPHNFESFLRLPIELQNIIWEMALDDRKGRVLLPKLRGPSEYDVCGNSEVRYIKHTQRCY